MAHKINLNETKNEGKNNMNKFILMLLVSIGLAFICGCDGSVSQVKNGTLGGHQDVTVGAAFDGSFDNTNWSTITDDKGRKIVRFTGKIKQSTHDIAVKTLMEDQKTLTGQSINDEYIVGLFKAEEFNKRATSFLKKDKSTDAKEVIIDEEEPTDEAARKLLKNLKTMDNFKKNWDELDQPTRVKIVKDLADDFKRGFWPVGKVAEFSFIVYPDGKKFEVGSFYDESQADLDFVLKVIFAK